MKLTTKTKTLIYLGALVASPNAFAGTIFNDLATWQAGLNSSTLDNFDRTSGDINPATSFAITGATFSYTGTTVAAQPQYDDNGDAFGGFFGSSSQLIIASELDTFRSKDGYSTFTFGAGVNAFAFDYDNFSDADHESEWTMLLSDGSSDVYNKSSATYAEDGFFGYSTDAASISVVSMTHISTLDFIGHDTLGGINTWDGVGIDNFRTGTIIPEPSSTLLVALGGLAFTLRRRRA